VHNPTLFAPEQTDTEFSPKRLDFFIKCEPPKTTSQTAGKRMSIRHGKPHFFKDKKHEDHKNNLAGLLSNHQPEEPIRGAVRLTVEATWPWRKSDLSTRVKQDRASRLCRLPFGGKPDADNFVKMIQDTLVALCFIERDEYVVELVVRKFIGSTPGIRFVIEEVMEDR
jgi:Holliday junction resolvase RusA-like endonuclease